MSNCDNPSSEVLSLELFSRLEVRNKLKEGQFYLVDIKGGEQALYIGLSDGTAKPVIYGDSSVWSTSQSAAKTDEFGQIIAASTQEPRVLKTGDDFFGLNEKIQDTASFAMATGPTFKNKTLNKDTVVLSSKGFKGYINDSATPFEFNTMEPPTRGYGLDFHTVINFRDKYDLTGGLNGTTKAYVTQPDETIVETPITVVDGAGNTVDNAWYSAGNRDDEVPFAKTDTNLSIFDPNDDTADDLKNAKLTIVHKPGVFNFPKDIKSAEVRAVVNFNSEPGIFKLDLTKNGVSVVGLPFDYESVGTKWQAEAVWRLEDILDTDDFSVTITSQKDDDTSLILGDDHCKIYITPIHVEPPFPPGELAKFRQGSVLGAGQSLEDAVNQIIEYDVFYMTNFFQDITTGSSGLSMSYKGQNTLAWDGRVSVNSPGVLEAVRYAKALKPSLQNVPYLELTAIADPGTFSAQFFPDRFTGPGPYTALTRQMFVQPFGSVLLPSVKIFINNAYYGYFDSVTETSSGSNVYEHTVTGPDGNPMTITYDIGNNTVSISPVLGTTDDVWVLHSEDYKRNGFVVSQAGKEQLRSLLYKTLSIPGLPVDGLKLDLVTATLLGTGNIDEGLRVIRELYDGPLHLNVTGRDVRSIRDLAQSRYIRDGDVFIVEGAFIAVGGHDETPIAGVPSILEGTLEAVGEIRYWQKRKAIRACFLMTQDPAFDLLYGNMTDAIAAMNNIRVASDIIAVEHSDLGTLPAGREIGSPLDEVKWTG